MHRCLVCLFLYLTCMAVFAQEGWRILGPGTGGAMFSLAPHPKNPDILYGGVDMGALFKTTDGGKNWKTLGGTTFDNPNPAVSGAFGVAVDPTNPETVWSISNNIFKSTDGGRRWTVMDQKPPLSQVFFEHVAIDASNGDIVYVASHRLYYHKGCIAKSTDGGKNWKTLAVCPQLDGRRDYLTLAINPYSPIIQGQGHSEVYAGSFQGLFVSRDAGENWTRLTTLPEGKVQNILFKPGKVLVNIIPHAGADKATEADKTSLVGGLYVSDDGCKTFQHRICGMEETMCKYSSLFNRDHRFFLAVYPKEPYTLFYAFGFSEIFRSDDEGRSWTPICATTSRWVKAPVPPIQEAYGFKGNYYFFPQTRDALPRDPWKCDWKHHSSQGAITWLCVSPADSDVIYFSHNSYVARTADGGKHWEELGCDIAYELPVKRWPDLYVPCEHTHAIRPRGLQLIVPNQVAFNPFNPREMAFAYCDLGLRISRDEGKAWEWSYDTASMMRSDSGSANCVLYDAKTPGLMYHGTGTWGSGNLFESRDGGRTWRNMHIKPAWDKAKDYQDKTGKDSKIFVWRIAKDQSSGTIFAGVRSSVLGQGGGLYATDDDGKSWRDCTPAQFGPWQVRDLVLDAKGRLWAGIHESRAANGLYLSNDLGKSWTKLNPQEIGGVRTNCIAVSGDTVYLNAYRPDKEGFWAHSVLWKSVDAGKSWSSLREGLISSVAVRPDDPGWLYLEIPRGLSYRAHEAGLFRSTDGGASWRRFDQDAFPESASRTRVELDPGNCHRVIHYALYGVWTTMDK